MRGHPIMWMCAQHACTVGTIKDDTRSSQKAPWSVHTCSSEDDSELEVFQSHHNNEDAAFDIRSFNAPAYKHMNISVKVDHIQCSQKLLRDVDPTNADEQEASYCDHSVSYRIGLHFSTAVQSAIELFYPFYIMDIEEGKMVLLSGCRGGDMAQCAYLNVFEVLHKSPDLALQ